MFSSLFWKVSGIFLIVLVLFAGLSMYFFVDATRMYEQEVNQRLNYDLAEHTVNEIKPLLEGEVQKEAIGVLMHSMMAINPRVEVYLLDRAGLIMKHVALNGEVVMDRVSLDPVHQALKGQQEGIIVGDDPRNPGDQKIFSVAPVNDESGALSGYVYIILAGQEYAGVAETLFGSYFMKASFRSVLIALLLTLILGLMAIYWITKNLNTLSEGFRKFRSGERGTRIQFAGGGELSQMAGTFNDMAGTIERNIEELEGVAQLRKELIGNVSHDLRTPIASIQGYAETLLLKEGTLDADKRREYLNTIVKSSERLKRLVNDLFELSKLEAGQVELELEPMSVGELVHDVVSNFRGMASKKGININTVLAKDLPIVEVDIQKIDRVLQNLLDNAIKFCSQGDQINIQLNAKTPESVEVRIEDTGIGIPSKDLPQIFDRYFMSERSSRSGGTGLGLAIVKRIVEMHGSDISVQSKENEGTTFSFDLPVRAAA